MGASHERGCLTCQSFYAALLYLMADSVFKMGASGKYARFEDAVRDLAKKAEAWKRLSR